MLVKEKFFDEIYFSISTFLFLFSISKAYSDIKEQIISNLEKTNNYSFNFIQQINKKKETEIVS